MSQSETWDMGGCFGGTGIEIHKRSKVLLLTRHGLNAKVRLSLASSSYGFFLWNYTETHERSFSNITTKDDLRMEGRKTVMPSSSDI